MKQKIWKNVVNYEGFYEISNEGDVRGVDRSVKTKNGFNKKIGSKNLKQRENISGYLIVYLFKNGKKKCQFIHRLIAEAFIPNPLKKPQINHINGIKLDNAISNLEWVTGSENMKHAVKMGLCKIPTPKSIAVFNLTTSEKYNSIKETAIANGIKYETLKYRLNPKNKLKDKEFEKID